MLFMITHACKDPKAARDRWTNTEEKWMVSNSWRDIMRLEIRGLLLFGQTMSEPYQDGLCNGTIYLISMSVQLWKMKRQARSLLTFNSELA